LKGLTNRYLLEPILFVSHPSRRTCWSKYYSEHIFTYGQRASIQCKWIYA